MIEEKNNKVKIICDKCKSESLANTDNYNDVFFNEGWGLMPNARKYHHICRNCQSKKQRKAHDFVANNF